MSQAPPARLRPPRCRPPGSARSPPRYCPAEPVSDPGGKQPPTAPSHPRAGGPAATGVRDESGARLPVGLPVSRAARASARRPPRARLGASGGNGSVDGRGSPGPRRPVTRRLRGVRGTPAPANRRLREPDHPTPGWAATNETGGRAGGGVCRPSASPLRSLPLSTTTSDQTRRPAEFKHITKRRKRN